jgi:sugar (pentulose or hexulose) kinase
MQTFLGIDIGTQSTRLALVDPGGRVLASYSEAYPLYTPRHGWAEQDPETWWGVICRGIPALKVQSGMDPHDILAIAVDSQMHATIPIDRTGSLLSHAVQLWCDKRGSGLVEQFQALPHASEAAILAGSPPVGAWIGFKIQWLKTYQPDLYEHAWKFLTASGLVNYRLTGELSMDWTEASGTFLMDARTNTWLPQLAGWLDLDLDKLPPIFRSADVIGQVTPSAARQLGLSPGTPVAAGGGDMLIMLLAAGLAEPGMALDISGTASNLVFYVDQPVLNPPLMNLHHPLPGWCPFGITESGGASLRWLRDTCLPDSASHLDPDQAYTHLTSLAAQVSPGSDGLLYFPYLMGERILGTPNARGAFIGLTPSHGLGALTRAVLEGVCFELRRTLELVEAAGNTIRAVIHTGGGARSPLWSQIKADIYHKPVHTLAVEEGGVLGSAILAMAASGYDPDIPSAVQRCVRTGQVFQPNPANFERYDALFALFKDLHDRLQTPYDRLATILK